MRACCPLTCQLHDAAHDRDRAAPPESRDLVRLIHSGQAVAALRGFDLHDKRSARTLLPHITGKLPPRTVALTCTPSTAHAITHTCACTHRRRLLLLLVLLLLVESCWQAVCRDKVLL